MLAPLVLGNPFSQPADTRNWASVGRNDGAWGAERASSCEDSGCFELLNVTKVVIVKWIVCVCVWVVN